MEFRGRHSACQRGGLRNSSGETFDLSRLQTASPKGCSPAVLRLGRVASITPARFNGLHGSGFSNAEAADEKDAKAPF